jgi:hypothetical protein
MALAVHSLIGRTAPADLRQVNASPFLLSQLRFLVRFSIYPARMAAEFTS